MKSIIVIGGGLAGLITAIRLARAGYKIQLIEKLVYPRHKVCGEYISMEVYDFLNREKLLPLKKILPTINHLHISSANGGKINLPLDFGGFGISRYYFENYLYEEAVSEGVDFIFQEAISVKYDTQYTVETRDRQLLHPDLVIAAYGKRNKLDKHLNRSFFKKHSPYVGIKFHARLRGMDTNTVELHNFSGGYCGICKVEDNITNFCYLVHREKLRSSGSIEKLENEVLSENPYLKEKLARADRLFTQPLVINEISFETKTPVEDDIIMIGDAAGMITPLCGNGMAMAIHTAKLLSDIIIDNPGISRFLLFDKYSREWRKMFAIRLAWGRFIQHYLFGHNWASGFTVFIGKNFPDLAKYLVRQTHGQKI